MENKENPNLTPLEYKARLETQLKALRKIRKIYRKQVLAGTVLYHTSLRNVNNQILDVLDELVNWDRDNPELNKSLAERFKSGFNELAKAAATVKR